jgi:hypothetical protein
MPWHPKPFGTFIRLNQAGAGTTSGCAKTLDYYRPIFYHQREAGVDDTSLYFYRTKVVRTQSGADPARRSGSGSET